VTFEAILAQVVEGLQQDVRVSCLALKRQFDLDDDDLGSGAICRIGYGQRMNSQPLNTPLEHTHARTHHPYG
jgi:hypothetical protein